MRGERSIGGLFCSEVLEHLSDYFDGRLSEPDRAKIERHLEGCDACERFGGTFGEAITALRKNVRAGTAPSPEALSKLRARLGK
ncbi:MAG TPA: anti-sigma factor [Polyangiaceae bacterium]|nr:anti-sigma factor [Polyangiaceae bacterium]